jgi:hypothetical protein
LKNGINKSIGYHKVTLAKDPKIRELSNRQNRLSSGVFPAGIALRFPLR